MLEETEEQEFVKMLTDPATQDEAFRKLLRQYQNPLYFHIRNIVLNHDDADDVLQNTFVKIFKNLNTFRGDSKLFSWMYRIATNESITFINNRAKRRGINADIFQQEQVELLRSDSYFDGDEIQLKLQKAISLLPQKQQLIFKMKYFQELKYEEISEILGTTVGGLKSSYFHAVKKIEEYMTNN